MKQYHKFCGGLLVAVLALGAPAAEGGDPWCWSDGSMVLGGLPPGLVEAELARITSAGAPAQLTLAVAADGSASVAPLGPGIHVLRAGDQERRFVALAPPPNCDPSALRAALPRYGERLLAGEPVTIVAFGDSVTATGDYPRFLAAMLARATGNEQISVRVEAHPGCSVDATLRNLATETAAGVDIGLLMYGLNDQGAGVPITAYREQSAAFVDAMAGLGADAVLLQPTPHIAQPEEPPADAEDPAWAFVMRTRGYAAELTALGNDMGVPVAPTFDALWGEGAASLAEVYAELAPLFPQHYSKHLTVMAGGKADTIHPNAWGHAQVAAAIYRRLAVGPAPEPALVGSGVTRWTEAGPVTELTLRNAGATARGGRVVAFGPPGTRLGGERARAYQLDPGEDITLSLTWPEVTVVDDLRRDPYDRYLAPLGCWFQVVDQQEASCRALAVRVEREPAVHLAVERQVVPAGGAATVRWLGADGVHHQQTMPAPAEAAVRVPLRHDVDGTPVVGELAWVRYAGALRGGTVIDGAHDEWDDAVWSPLGLPAQARWTRGPADFRAAPEECLLRWSLRAGDQGFAVALRLTGGTAKDGFTLWFDPRPAAQLGTAGGYVWVDGRFDGDQLRLNAGETSRGRPGRLEGAWRAVDGGRELEVFVPYGHLGLDAWPADGDLGVSLLWTHAGETGRTRLQWSEDRHPWNPRWFGVARLQDTPDADALPWMVRSR